MNFKVVTIAPGSWHIFDGAEDTMLKIISVAWGEVEVTMCGKGFNMSSGGMWRIAAGQQCFMSQRGAGPTVLYVSSIKRD